MVLKIRLHIRINYLGVRISGHVIRGEFLSCSGKDINYQEPDLVDTGPILLPD